MSDIVHWFVIFRGYQPLAGYLKAKKYFRLYKFFGDDNEFYLLTHTMGGEQVDPYLSQLELELGWLIPICMILFNLWLSQLYLLQIYVSRWARKVWKTVFDNEAAKGTIQLLNVNMVNYGKIFVYRNMACANKFFVEINS